MLLVPVIAIYLAIRWLQKTPAEQSVGRIKKTAWVFFILLLLLLALSGKLNMLFAAIGVAIAFIVRLLPLIVQYAPQLRRLWQNLNKQRPRDGRQYTRGPARTGMSKAEALDVLGLKSGATESQIVAAHRKLISRLHPDRGGSDYLAAQINLAKKILLEN
nr:molecular chaperone DnaJ [Methylomonas sp. SURF-2]